MRSEKDHRKIRIRLTDTGKTWTQVNVPQIFHPLKDIVGLLTHEEAYDLYHALKAMNSKLV
jgi:hypothetical protein